MKKLAFLFFILCTSLDSVSQSPEEREKLILSNLAKSNRSTIDDVVLLNKITENNGKVTPKICDAIAKLLSEKYNIPITWDSANNKFSGIPPVTVNPYLFDFLTDINSLRLAALTEINTINVPSNSLDVLTPSGVADILGTFIANRFKQEINIAFLDEFKKKIDGSQELKTLLPNTNLVLSQNDPYNYTTFFQALREAFNSDLNKLPKNGVAFFTNKIDGAANKEDIVALALGLDITADLLDKKGLHEIISGLDKQEYLKKLQSIKPDLYASVKSMSLLSRNLITDAGDSFSKNVTELKKPEIAKLFLGLLLGKEKSDLTLINFNVSGTSKNMNQLIIESYTNLAGGQDYFNNLILNFNSFTNSIKSLKDIEKNKQKSPISNYLNLIESSLKLIEAGTKFEKLNANIPVSEFQAKIEKAKEYVDLTNLVVDKQYGLALAKLTFLVTSSGVISSNSEALQNLSKYGNFAVNVVNAKTNDEAVQALESAALPVGSYRIKRNNYFNISINAYGGLFVGKENFGYENDKRTSTVWGATAPVGIYFGFGKSQNKVKENDGNGVGLFVSLLDVGSVFAVRLQGDTNPLPELAWRNIIAPGLNIVYNIPKLPISIMFGYQKGPELRSLNTVKNPTTMQDELKTVIDPYAGRFHISAVVDIPVFNIYTKANKNN